MSRRTATVVAATLAGAALCGLGGRVVAQERHNAQADHLADEIASCSLPDRPEFDTLPDACKQFASVLAQVRDTDGHGGYVRVDRAEFADRVQRVYGDGRVFNDDRYTFTALAAGLGGLSWYVSATWWVRSREEREHDDWDEHDDFEEFEEEFEPQGAPPGPVPSSYS